MCTPHDTHASQIMHAQILMHCTHCSTDPPYLYYLPEANYGDYLVRAKLFVDVVLLQEVAASQCVV